MWRRHVVIPDLERAVPDLVAQPETAEQFLGLPASGSRGVLVAAAEPAMADGITSLLTPHPQRLNVVESVATIGAAERALSTYRPPLAVLVLDPPLADAAPADAIARLVAAQPATAALVLLARPTPDLVRRACRSGARGVYDTAITPAELLDALTQIAAGEVVVQPALVQHLLGTVDQTQDPPPAQRLSPRALTALQLLARGYASKEIAPILGTTPKAVNLTIERVCRQIGAATRAEAVAIAIGRGLIS